MKIQCNVCEVAEAKVLCCADEAVLCIACDEKVHAANKLASKHQRVSLSNSSSQMPQCDICQETVGYFFCLEDRALLCRKCDVAIHTANTYVLAHQRFLLTGVKVGLEPTEPGASTSVKSQSNEKRLGTDSRSMPRRGASLPSTGPYKVLPTQVTGNADLSAAKSPFAGGSAAGSIPQWQLDEYVGFSEFDQNYGFMDNGSSKADSGKLGDSNCSPILRSVGELDGDECLGQVPESSWAVPEIPSPPTASGLYWPKLYQKSSDATVFVPDICFSPLQGLNYSDPNEDGSKRRQHC